MSPMLTAALPTSASFTLISLVLCCDVCEPALIMGLGGCCCPCHILLRGAGSQTSQKHMCTQKFCKTEILLLTVYWEF